MGELLHNIIPFLCGSRQKEGWWFVNRTFLPLVTVYYHMPKREAGVWSSHGSYQTFQFWATHYLSIRYIHSYETELTLCSSLQMKWCWKSTPPPGPPYAFSFLPFSFQLHCLLLANCWSLILKPMSWKLLLIFALVLFSQRFLCLFPQKFLC